MSYICESRKSLVFRCDDDRVGIHVTDEGLIFGCTMPWLSGPKSQLLAYGSEMSRLDHGWILKGRGVLSGVLIGKSRAPIREESRRLYRSIFSLTRGLNCYRVWTFVPDINAVVDQIENYQSFNSGRHQAFVDEFDGIYPLNISAASAVGIKGDALVIAFVAGRDRVDHFENPLQVAAAKYPEIYGKNPPLFARGSKITNEQGTPYWHLSGTASIRVSDTIGRDFMSQLEITLENISRMLGTMNVPLQRYAAWKIFLRDRKYLSACKKRLNEIYPDEIEQMVFVETDICRSDLLLEIEAFFYIKS